MSFPKNIYDHFTYKPDDAHLKRGWHLAGGVYLSLVGAYPGFDGTYKASVVGFSFSIVLIFSCPLLYFSVHEAFRTRETEILCEALSFTGMEYVYLAGYYMLFIQRRSLEEMYRMVGEGFYRYRRPLTANESACLENKLMDFLLRFNYVATMSTSGIYFFAAPLVKIYLTGEISTETDNPEEYGYNKNFPTRLGFPFKTNTLGVYIPAFIFELVLCTYSSMVMLAMVNQFLGLNVQLWSQLLLLKTSLDDIHNRATYAMKEKGKIVTDGDISDNQEWQKCLIGCLNENIAHHNQTLRYFRKFQNLYSAWLLPLLFSYGLFICLTFYRLLTNDTSDGLANTGFKVLGQVMLLILLVLHSAIYCLAGQRTSNLNEDVWKCLYDVPWYKCGNRITKSLCVMMANSQSDMVLSGMGIIPCNANTLLDIIKSAYTTTNFIQTVGLK